MTPIASYRLGIMQCVCVCAHKILLENDLVKLDLHGEVKALKCRENCRLANLILRMPIMNRLFEFL